MRLPHIYMKSSQIANRAYNLEPIRHGPLIKFSPNHSEWSQEWCTIFTAGDEIIAAHSSAPRADTPGQAENASLQSKLTLRERSICPAGRTPSIQLCAQHASLTGICSSLLYIGAGIYKKCKFITRFPQRTHTTTMPFDSLYNYRSVRERRKRESLLKY